MDKRRTGHENGRSDELLVLLRDAHHALGTPLSIASARTWAKARGRSFPAERTFAVHFGGWSAACEAAGVPHAHAIGDTPPGPTPTTAQECWHALQSFVDECDRLDVAPTMERYQLRGRECDWPSRNTLRLRLGLGWRAAVDAARLMQPMGGRRVPKATTHVRRAEIPAPTADAMLEAMATAAVDYDGRLSIAQYREWLRRRPGSHPPPDAIRARFGSWSTACRSAGIHAGRGGWPAIDVAVQLQRACATLGEPFTMNRFREWAKKQAAPVCHLTPETAARAFGSWRACQAVATAPLRKH